MSYLNEEDIGLTTVCCASNTLSIEYDICFPFCALWALVCKEVAILFRFFSSSFNAANPCWEEVNAFFGRKFHSTYLKVGQVIELNEWLSMYLCDMSKS